MREILFRGKGIDNNWYYGVPLVFTEDYVCMTAPHTYNKKVEANTIGQFTGLTDKNGKKVFEGDLLKWDDRIVKVVWLAANSQFDCNFVSYANDKIVVNFKGLEPRDWKECEVIGNIHDNKLEDFQNGCNPKLLEKT